MSFALAVYKGVPVGMLSGHPGQQDVGYVPLYLVDSAKSVEMAPGRIALGLIRLRGWQVHRLAPVPADLAGQAAYLVRVNYEFDIAPDVQAPAWAEVGFRFPDPEVVVYDAVPTRVVEQADAVSYELTGQLNFVRRDGSGGGSWPPRSPAANIALPALIPRIDSFGPSGSLIRWRHTDGVPAGTHTGWWRPGTTASRPIPVSASAPPAFRTPSPSACPQPTLTAGPRRCPFAPWGTLAESGPGYLSPTRMNRPLTRPR